MSSRATTSESIRRPGSQRGAPVIPTLAISLFLAAPLQADDRSTEILKFTCANEFNRREITLFKNGTIRLREGSWDDQKMYLAEIGPEAVADNIRVLADAYAVASIDSLKEPILEGVHGPWTMRCELYLALPELEPFTYAWSSYAIAPLKVSRIVAIAEELTVHVASRMEELPAGYEPRPGDVLRTAEGLRFRVLRRTADGIGVELEGIDQPLVIYVGLFDLDKAFVALEERERR